MTGQWWVDMPIEERARRLVGDMPWVTEHLTPKQLADLPKQIETCILAAVCQEREACAKVAANPYGDDVAAYGYEQPQAVGLKIADAIKARK